MLMITISTSSCMTKHTGSINKNEIYLDYIFYKSLELAYNNDTIFNKDASASALMDLSGFTIIEELGDYLNIEAERRVNELEPSEYPDYVRKKFIFYDLLKSYNDEKLSKKILKEIKAIRKKEGTERM